MESPAGVYCISHGKCMHVLVLSMTEAQAQSDVYLVQYFHILPLVIEECYSPVNLW